MGTVSARSILVVASLQAITALAALSSSTAAALAAAVIGVLAAGRYLALSCFAATLGSSEKAVFHALAGSAWAFGMMAMTAAIAVVALKASLVLPWAIAAAVAGPLGMSALALCSGIRALFSNRSAAGRPASAGAAHPGGLP
jgi:cobalamin synthase